MTMMTRRRTRRISTHNGKDKGGGRWAQAKRMKRMKREEINK